MTLWLRAKQWHPGSYWFVFLTSRHEATISISNWQIRSVAACILSSFLTYLWMFRGRGLKAKHLRHNEIHNFSSYLFSSYLKNSRWKCSMIVQIFCWKWLATPTLPFFPFLTISILHVAHCLQIRADNSINVAKACIWNCGLFVCEFCIMKLVCSTAEGPPTLWALSGWLNEIYINFKTRPLPANKRSLLSSHGFRNSITLSWRQIQILFLTLKILGYKLKFCNYNCYSSPPYESCFILVCKLVCFEYCCAG